MIRVVNAHRDPDAWDYDAVLRENEVIVEWCDTLVDGNGNEHRAGEFAGWGFCWEHGAIHIGQCSEQIARKAAALFVSLWLRGVSASFCDKIMSGMIWFWELQIGPAEATDLRAQHHISEGGGDGGWEEGGGRGGGGGEAGRVGVGEESRRHRAAAIERGEQILKSKGFPTSSAYSV